MTLNIVMDYCEQGDLPNYIKLMKTARRWDVNLAVHIMHDIVCGLAHIHSKRICHRDIKPDNILVSEHTAKLADFGDAYLVRGEPVALDLRGTPLFTAPEVFRVSGTRNCCTVKLSDDV